MGMDMDAIPTIAITAGIDPMNILCLFSFFGLLSPLPALTADQGGENNQQKQPGLQLQQEQHSPASVAESVVTFIPPAGWKMADAESLSPNVKALVIAPVDALLPPSINIATEKYPGTVKEYLKLVKSIAENRGSHWRDLGPFDTKAGKGQLSQLDCPSKWGDMRMMHLILKNEGIIYIITVAALKEDFSVYYKEFFNALSSLQIENCT